MMSDIAEKQRDIAPAITPSPQRLFEKPIRRYAVESVRNTLVWTMRVADLAIIVLAGALSLRFSGLPASAENAIWFQIVAASLFGLIVLECVGFHRWNPVRTRTVTFFGLVAAWVVTVCALLVLNRLLAISDPLFYGWLATFALSGGVLLLGERIAIARWTASKLRTGALITNVVLVGYPESTRKVADRLAARIGSDLHIVAELDLAGVHVLDTLRDLCRRANVAQILVALPRQPDERVEMLLHELQNFAINLQLIPELPCSSTPRFGPGEIDCVPAISLINRPLSASQCMVKRLEDLILCSAILCFAGPLMALIAILVRLDSAGPALFRQIRWGYNFAPIEVLKFRTMYVSDAPDPSVVQARRGDPRVTRLGYWLRKTSLDELPQLLNVFRGDMSLVGPRPHAVPHNEHYSALIDNYLARHKLKPGMTGLAQVNGYRGITDTLDKMQKRVELDLCYMESWSLLLDLRILVKTIFVGFANPNAF